MSDTFIPFWGGIESSKLVILSPASAALLFLLLIAFAVTVNQFQGTLKELPGPSPLPFIGNLHQAPTEFACRKYHEWSKEYGPVYKLKYGLSNVVIVGDCATAKELLDKRGSIYSSRPHMPMAGDCVTRGLYTGMMPYDARFRAHQRLQGSYLNNSVSQSYTPVQDLESKHLIVELLSSNDFSNSFLRYASSLLFALCYGKRLPSGDETEAREIQQIGHDFVKATRVGYWIVDSLPILNYLPRFLAPWKRFADKLYKYEEAVHLRNMASAENMPSWNWSKHVLDNEGSQVFPRVELAYHIGMVFSAGTETSVHTLNFFVLAAILHPEIMKKARGEVYSVVGYDRMPDFQDLKNMPYIDALFREILRWHPVTTLALPHATTEEDTYLGYRIPKGSTVLGNTWGLSQDTSVFTNPSEFNPSRWIENQSLPVVGWGFGRRICPGQYIAKNSLCMIFARLLWAFDIEGVGKKPNDMEWTQGLSTGPVPFEAKFTPRSRHIEEVIRRDWAGTEKDINVLLNDVQHKAAKFGLDSETVRT